MSTLRESVQGWHGVVRQLRHVAAVAILALAACAGPHHWVHQGAPGDFKRDAFDCNQMGYHASGDFETMAALNMQCMESRGWKLVRD